MTTMVHTDLGPPPSSKYKDDSAEDPVSIDCSFCFLRFQWFRASRRIPESSARMLQAGMSVNVSGRLLWLGCRRQTEESSASLVPERQA